MQILSSGHWPVLISQGRTQQQAKPRKANLPVYYNFSSSQRGGWGRGRTLSLSTHTRMHAHARTHTHRKTCQSQMAGETKLSSPSEDRDSQYLGKPTPEQTRNWQKCCCLLTQKRLGLPESVGRERHPQAPQALGSGAWRASESPGRA